MVLREPHLGYTVTLIKKMINRKIEAIAVFQNSKVTHLLGGSEEGCRANSS